MNSIEHLIDTVRRHPDADREMIAEMQAELERETQKPVDERDYDRIAALSEAICKAAMPQDVLEHSEQEGIAAVMIRQNRTQNRKAVFVRVTALCACLILVCGGFLLFRRPADIPPAEKSGELRMESEYYEGYRKIDDVYGIRKECEGHGFSPRLPLYLPAGFSTGGCGYYDFIISNNERRLCVESTFRNEKQSIRFQFISFPDEEAPPDWLMQNPAPEGDVSKELVFGDVTVTEVWNPGIHRCWMIFFTDRVYYSIFSTDVNIEEMEKVLRSMFD